MRMTISRTRTARPARPISSGSVMRSSLRLPEAPDQGDAGSERQQGARDQARDDGHPVGNLKARCRVAVGLWIEQAEGHTPKPQPAVGQGEEGSQQGKETQKG